MVSCFSEKHISCPHLSQWTSILIVCCIPGMLWAKKLRALQHSYRPRSRAGPAPSAPFGHKRRRCPCTNWRSNIAVAHFSAQKLCSWFLLELSIMVVEVQCQFHGFVFLPISGSSITLLCQNKSINAKLRVLYILLTPTTTPLGIPRSLLYV